MFKWFEKRVDPYPEEGLNQPLPTTFFPFVWQAAKGVRGYLLILVLFTAGAASFEALFYAKIGDLVNWLRVDFNVFNGTMDDLRKYCIRP